jgi:tetratricopeptide (TPR) repeat protein
LATISEAFTIALEHHQGGRLQAAEQIYRQILQVEPNHSDALHLLGVIAYQVGRHEVAIEYIGRALQVKPDYAEAHNNLGLTLMEKGSLDEAIACYQRSLALKPDYAEAHSNLGNALKDQGRLDEAIDCQHRALRLKPDFAEAHSSLGAALKDQGRLNEAVVCQHGALRLKPDYAEAHSNLGAALSEQGKLDEAVACYWRAVAMKPDLAETHSNLGLALCAQGKLDEAAACYRRALALKPDYAEAHWNQSLLVLLTGDFERGWAEYEWRWRSKQQRFQRRDFSQPLWDGEPLAGRTILVHAEQGLGDTIQFVRYLPLVKQRGGAVIFECPRALLPLLSSCAGIDRVVARGDELPAFEVQAPLLSLPGIFHAALGAIPAAIPYLAADPGLVQQWRQELSGSAGFKIGIAWQGDPKHRNDHARSIPLDCFEPLAQSPGVELISLQKETGVEQLQGRYHILDLGDRLDAAGAFLDTAAIMMNLDLIIAADSAVAHLAGALGVPVWLALPFAPDWRWLLKREDSPWYPHHRLFRQSRPGDWNEVFERIAGALRGLVLPRTRR